MPTLEQAKERFAEAGLTRTDRYQQGTEGKGSVWNSSKERAKVNYAPAMQEALANKSFDKGLDDVDAGDYDRGIREKGVNNWGVNMQASAEKFAEKIGKFVPLWDRPLTTPRGARRSQANMKRMQENVMRFAEAGK